MLIKGTAVFSPCARYRYTLTRTWDARPEPVFLRASRLCAQWAGLLPLNWMEEGRPRRARGYLVEVPRQENRCINDLTRG